jgi:hypothetical protein
MYTNGECTRDHSCLRDASLIAMLRNGRRRLIAVPLVCPVCGRGPQADKSNLEGRIRKYTVSTKGLMCPVCLRG